MSNDFFRFKRFCIRHDRCGMKVGTDGVLIGAWGCVDGRRILDIGTGSGLIALMAAQRNPQARVLGIDIDEQAVFQAQENVAASPFSDRVECVVQDALAFRPDEPFDAVLCNPPFFTEDTLPVDDRRSAARNNMALPFPLLIECVAAFLSPDGSFSLIVPAAHVMQVTSLCLACGLHLQRRCMVRTVERKPPRRAMLCFTVRKQASVEETSLCLTSSDGSRSQDYKALTRDFYLEGL